MRTFLALLLLAGALAPLRAQSPRLYIQLVSHNEPNDNLQNNLNYQKAKSKLLTMANLVRTKNARWNLQTADGLVLGARADQLSTGSNIFATLAATPYRDYIEIDPRPKNLPGRNIADQWFLLDSLGARPSTTVGGFIYTVCAPSSSALIDWWQYQDTLTGLYYKNKLKFTLLSGAGSLPPHCDDLNDFGIFKPDTVTHFYAHNPARNLWCVGTGCAPVLDSLSDEKAIIARIKGQVDSIQKGLWPADKFYVTRIMTNQREYGPLFFSKLTRVLDSLALIPDSRLHWATISETFRDFQAWTLASSRESSMWPCDHASTGTGEAPGHTTVTLFPNPFSAETTLQAAQPLENATLTLVDMCGRMVRQIPSLQGQTLTLSRAGLPDGLYFLTLRQDAQLLFSGKVVLRPD